MSTLLEQLEYGFDRDSRRSWRRRALATGQDDAYGYDGLSQVVNAARGNLNLNATAIGGVPAGDESWDYDPTGNWRGYRVEENGAVTLEQQRVHDKGNRLMQMEGSAGAVLVDRAGRMTQVPPDAAGEWNQEQRMVWDAWSRLVSVADDVHGVTGSYSYDGLNRRMTRVVSGVTWHTYYSDAWRPLEERQDDQTTAARQYYWGARHRDDLVRRDRAVTSGGSLDETRYVLMDYFSPAAITDGSGNVTERYAFSAFGVRSIMAPDFSPRATSECAWGFGFQGQFLDTESGFYDYGYRYYSPSLGRWLSKDPIAEQGGLNIYAFAENDGVNKVDYLGLATINDLFAAYQQLMKADAAQNSEDSFAHQQVLTEGQQLQNLGEGPSEEAIDHLLRDIDRTYKRITGANRPPSAIPREPDPGWHAWYKCKLTCDEPQSCEYECNFLRISAGTHSLIAPLELLQGIPDGVLFKVRGANGKCLEEFEGLFTEEEGLRIIS